MEDEVIMIGIDRIRVLNPSTRDKKKIEQIVQSIKNLGLKKPIQVSLRTPEEGTEWHLEAVRICSAHLRPLVEGCPHCRPRPGALTRHSRPGFCPVSKPWLRAVPAKALADPP